MCLDTFSTPGAANGPPKMKPFTVFLFEQIMIFSEIVGKKTQFTSPVYVYKAHFLVRRFKRKCYRTYCSGEKKRESEACVWIGRGCWGS